MGTGELESRHLLFLVRMWPEDLGDGPVWKWMALDAGVLYALVGEKEPPGDALKGPGFRGAGWPWWKIDQYAWGFGRTILAIDPASKKILFVGTNGQGVQFFP